MDAARLKELKAFVDECKADPSLLSDPSLAFFRDFLERYITIRALVLCN